jgi:hypothetical protein
MFGHELQSSTIIMFYANLYFVYKLQIHVKTGILEIISRIQTNNVVVNIYLVLVTVDTSLGIAT